MTNVALNKPVTMSSMHQYPPTPTPEMLTDGNRSDVYPCPHSELETNPEAIIDLEQTYGITGIYIVNRVDCCPQRLHDLIIQIGDTLADLKTVFNHTSPIGDTCTILFGAPQHGRYVKLYIEGTEYLTICEVEVYSDL
ncbi:fucolectin-1-like [Ruditapes philippinarum]|uniref:fucolectin-1-like n=1 Tax=Ruditapes philippinarum TaxID=129788 RepID=UPI00295BDCFF|nr:fucolectin-1-like [Ruditapes philippinarum]